MKQYRVMIAQSKIITFYSYKGGVGRSMALANVAWLLAAKYGKKVLVVDWDLEAPGLHRFFRIEPKQISIGLIDLFETYKVRLKQAGGPLPGKLVDISSSLIEVPLKEAVNGGSLFLIGAGKQDHDYVKRVNAFDWNEFYDTWHGYGFFEYLKTELKRTAEIILLDSRTGVTDIGGICTLQLPDIVVLLFALNEQNIFGTEFIAESIIKNAPELSENAKAPEIMIRPARVEKYLEQDKKNDWEQKAATRLQKYLPKGQENPLKFLKQNSIPYIGAYSFGETPLACESISRQADEPAVSFDALTISILKICGLWTESTEGRAVLDEMSFVSSWQIQVVLFYMLGIATLLVIFIFLILPSIDASSGEWNNVVSILGKQFSLRPTARLFLISMASGGLGGDITGMRRFVFYVGTRTATPKLRSIYLQPLIGMMLALLVVFPAIMTVVRVTGSQLNAFGIMAVSVLIGLYSDTVIKKLSDFFPNIPNRN
jgi:hypothetical protein